MAAELESTAFMGYEALEHPSCVLALVVNGQPAERASAGDAVQLVLDTTPFYGEGGGQVGDRGVLAGAGSGDGPAAEGVIVAIEGVGRNRSVFVHSGRVERGSLAVGDLVNARVDRACRRRVQAHHTATHLLQAALKQVVDPAIGQAGSLVDFERLRFDFHCPRAVTPAELEQIEALINGWIADAHALEVRSMAIEQARSAGAVAMFGEKYGDVVRVVDVPGVSMELCGGTHVANTAEIGLFKIVAEAGVAAGIRRIEAVAGPAVLAYLNERDAVVRALGDRFKAQPGEIVERVAALQEELRGSQKALAAVRGELAVANAERVLAEKFQNIKVDNRNYQLLIGRVDGIEGGDLKNAAKQLQERSGGNSLVIIASVTKGKVGFGTSFGKDVVNEYCDLDAGKLTNEYSLLCGGGGGGTKYQAQAGGRDPSALDEAMEKAGVTIREILNKGSKSKQIYRANIFKSENSTGST
jgi:alanyl-tRNA synthetase